MTLAPSLRAIVLAALDEWHTGAGRTITEDDETYALADALTALASGSDTPSPLWLAYQPIVDLANSRMVAAEALVRPGPALAQLLPDAPAIVRTAERSGLIVPLGAWVMATALVDGATWRQATAPELQIHVNASPLELKHGGYLDRVTEMLTLTSMPANALVVEVTESAALDREGDAQHALVALAGFGVEIALDDFGTGFASLDLLAATPARVLKLDRSFVTSLSDAETVGDAVVRGRAVITQAAVGMARSLGLDLVGEGIEAAAQARTLMGWGCQFGQGYLYGHPVPADELDLRSTRSTDGAVVARRIPLSPEAVDIGIALARILVATDMDKGALRAMAMSAATVICSSLGVDRRRAEAALLLTAIADGRQRLGDMPEGHAGLSDDLSGLLERLNVAPVIRRDTSAGAIARTAWAVATSRTRGDGGLDPALLAAHPDPKVHAELLNRVRHWWEVAVPKADARGVLRELEQQLNARTEVDHRLRSFVGLARAIGATGSLSEVLEIAAEEGRRLVGASTIVITRWDSQRATTRPIVAVGATHIPHELNEHVPQATFPLSTARVAQRMIHFEIRDETDGDPGERELLKSLGHGSSASVPIIVDEAVWGVTYATTAADAPPFTLADGPVLSAVASFLAAAITRVENLAQLEQSVHTDQLTGLANRQRLNTHVATLLSHASRATPLAAAVIDLVGLKDLNRQHGHEFGDALLRATAGILRTAVADLPDALVARHGGDEFCLVASVSSDELTQRVVEILAAAHGDPSFTGALCAGIAAAHPGDRRTGAVISRAGQVQRQALAAGALVARDISDTPFDGEIVIDIVAAP